LVLSPAEVIIAHRPEEQRIGSLRWSLPRGTVVAGLASVTVAAGALPLAGDVDLADVSPLVVTAVAFTLISPVQDHIRRVLHTAGRSGQASLVSAANLVATAVSAFVLLVIDPLWVAFGSMTIGNIFSCLVAIAFVKGQHRTTPVSSRELVAIGRYLLVVGLSNSGGSYLAGTLVGTIAGPAALGYVEAARLVARPLDVSTQGVMAAMGPRLMVASANRDRDLVRGLSRTVYLAILAVSLGYIVLVATPIAWGIPRGLFPVAYEVSGLVLAMLLTQLVISATRPLQALLMGLRREISLAVLEVLAQIGRLVASLSAVWIGAFGLPAGDLVAHGFKFSRYWMTFRASEADPRHIDDTGDMGPGER
jgi:O-antigen/teichoic acid export membrane protein